MMKVYIISCLFSLFALSSCQHDPFPYDDTGDSNPTDPVDTCDANLVYFNQVKPVFDGCAISGCHDGKSLDDDGDIIFSLLDYSSIVSNLLEDGDISNWNESELYKVLVKEANDPDKRMPPPPMEPLDQATIDLLKTWVLQGATDVECGGCDTLSIGYSSHIEKFMSISCKPCHNSSATSVSIDLSTYGLAVANASNMLERMERNEGAIGFMPNLGVKNNCNVELLRLWIQNNYPN